MQTLGEFLSWIVVSLLFVWVTGMIFAGDKCTRVYRSAWPITYGMSAVESLSKNWVDDDTKLKLLLWKARVAVSTQHFFEKTVYGDEAKCAK